MKRKKRIFGSGLLGPIILPHNGLQIYLFITCEGDLNNETEKTHRGRGTETEILRQRQKMFQE